jgi:hypothetical protein
MMKVILRLLRGACAAFVGVSLFATAPHASAQGTLNVSEIAFEDFNNSIFNPTVIPMPLGTGVNMISGRVAEVFINEEFGFDVDYDYFRVLNPALLPIASISIQVTGFSTVGMTAGQFELVGNQIPTFAPGKLGVISQGTGVNNGILVISDNGTFTLEAFIYDPSELTFALFPPEVENDGAFNYTVNITTLPVPEPSTWTLLGGALVAGAFALRRRVTG